MDCGLPGSSVHGDSPGKNTGVCCHALLQGIFPTQRSNSGLPYHRWILYHLSHQGNPRILEWVAYPFSRGNFPTQESNQGLLHCRWIYYQLSYPESPGQMNSRTPYDPQTNCNMQLTLIQGCCKLSWIVILFLWGGKAGRGKKKNVVTIEANTKTVSMPAGSTKQMLWKTQLGACFTEASWKQCQSLCDYFTVPTGTDGKVPRALPAFSEAFHGACFSLPGGNNQRRINTAACTG